MAPPAAGPPHRPAASLPPDRPAAWLWPRSLRGRLVALSTAASAVVLAVTVALVALVASVQLDNTLDGSLRERWASAFQVINASNAAELPQSGFTLLVGADGRVLDSVGPTSIVTSSRFLSADERDRALREGETFRDVDLGDLGEVRVYAQRVTINSGVPDAGVPAVLAVAGDLAPLRQLRARLLAVLLVSAPLLLGLLGVVVSVVVRSALRPVDALTREAAGVSEADADRRLPVSSSQDEIGRLATTLNQMLDRIAVGVRRERSFVDDASHELRTPVAVLQGELELALSALDDPVEVETSLRNAHAEAVRLGRLSEDLLVLARERAGTLVVAADVVDLGDLVTSASRRLSAVVGLALVPVVPGRTVVRGDAARLEQAVTNLVVNADAAGASRVELRVADRGRDVALEVADDGPGFPPALAEAAFSRFTRGDEARTRTTGAGLGLAIVAAVARGHGGRAEVGRDEVLGGAVVRLVLRSSGPPEHTGDSHVPVMQSEHTEGDPLTGPDAPAP